MKTRVANLIGCKTKFLATLLLLTLVLVGCGDYYTVRLGQGITLCDLVNEPHKYYGNVEIEIDGVRCLDSGWCCYKVKKGQMACDVCYDLELHGGGCSLPGGTTVKYPPDEGCNIIRGWFYNPSTPTIHVYEFIPCGGCGLNGQDTCL